MLMPIDDAVADDLPPVVDAERLFEQEIGMGFDAGIQVDGFPVDPDAGMVIGTAANLAFADDDAAIVDGVGFAVNAAEGTDVGHSLAAPPEKAMGDVVEILVMLFRLKPADDLTAIIDSFACAAFSVR